VIGLGDTSVTLRRRLTGSAVNVGGTIPPQGSLAFEQTNMNVYTQFSESES
jgi:hypothetical protein